MEAGWSANASLATPQHLTVDAPSSLGVFSVLVDGARWFGWYECGGSSNSVTADGIPWILSEDKDAHKDDSFTAMIAEQMSEVLTWDDDATYSFTVYNQTDCDYTWHLIANDHGDRR